LVKRSLDELHFDAPTSIAEVLDIDRRTREHVDGEVKASCH